MDHLPADRVGEIFKFYTIHEKKYGERAGIENVIVSKRRHQYEKVRLLVYLKQSYIVFRKSWFHEICQLVHSNFEFE